MKQRFMSQVCLYLQLHQPFRIKDFNIFDIGQESSYFSTGGDKGNRTVFNKVAYKSYLPMLKLLQYLIDEHEGFKFTLSCSGMFLEQAEEYEPALIGILQQLAKTDRVEFLAETYHHTLASVYSKDEFEKQVDQHLALIKKLFNQTPIIFRNTELIYSNQIAQQVSQLGFKGMLTEAVDRHLNDKRTRIFSSKTKEEMPLLLKHAQLSDDIAFRFSNRSWQWYPLMVDRYLEWIEIYPEDEIINLFMDFETFGEHQWEDTGIFDFFAHFVARFLNKSWNKFRQPAELLTKFLPTDRPTYDVHYPISWADIDRDLTAWVGNDLQQDTLRTLYELEKPVLQSNNQQLIQDWRRLQTSDHFYYMCTKWSADGDVHSYFSPYGDPFEAYRRFSIVLADLRERLL